MIKTNMGVHSKYSQDSFMTLEQIAEFFKKQNVRYVGITDIIELNKDSLEDIIEKFKIRNAEITMLNEKYEGKITLLKSAEIINSYLYAEEIKRLNELDFDYTVGVMNPLSGSDILKLTSGEQITREYYERILRMIHANNVDLIRYFDRIDQFLGKDYSSLKQMGEVMCALKESNQALEISTSTIRGSIEFYPSIQKLCFYRLKQEDAKVVIGKDIRSKEELQPNYEELELACTEIGLTPGIYQKRKFERI